MNQIISDVRVLSETEMALIHKSSLDILEKVGLSVPHEGACRLAQALGAKVDVNDDYRMTFPREALLEVLERIKREDPSVRAHDGGLEKLTGNVSTQIFLVDGAARTRRPGTLGDVMDGIFLQEGLENFPRANAIVVPADAPEGMSDILSYQMIYKYSKKPGGTYVLTADSARYITRMARAAGQEVTYLFDTVSPLTVRRETLEIAMIFREAGFGMSMTPMVMAGSTGPVSLAGMITLQNAEVLASLFLIYALSGRGAKYVVGGHTNDISRNMFCSFGSPNQALIGVAAAQMARFYGLRSGSNAGLTDAVIPDFQSAAEKVLSASFACLAGTSAIGGQGIAGADQGFSMEQLVLDNEWISMYNHVARGFTVDEDAIGLETIFEVGRGGNFLSEMHTVEYMRDSHFQSALFDRDSWDNLRGRVCDPLTLAHERAQELIARHRVKDPVVAPAVAEEIDRIAAEAARDFARR